MYTHKHPTVIHMCICHTICVTADSKGGETWSERTWSERQPEDEAEEEPSEEPSRTAASGVEICDSTHTPDTRDLLPIGHPSPIHLHTPTLRSVNTPQQLAHTTSHTRHSQLYANIRKGEGARFISSEREDLAQGTSSFKEQARNK